MKGDEQVLTSLPTTPMIYDRSFYRWKVSLIGDNTISEVPRESDMEGEKR
jgi:hypothetical protein